MAKTVKTSTKKKNVDDNLIIDDEPILVNEKNEIIYNPDEELAKIIEPIKQKTVELTIDENIMESIEYLKNNNSEIPNLTSENIEETTTFIEQKIEEMNEIKEKLDSNNTKPKKFNFSSFWNGTSMNW